jgi:hypothetical protein
MPRQITSRSLIGSQYCRYNDASDCVALLDDSEASHSPHERVKVGSKECEIMSLYLTTVKLLTLPPQLNHFAWYANQK